MLSLKSFFLLMLSTATVCLCQYPGKYTGKYTGTASVTITDRISHKNVLTGHVYHKWLERSALITTLDKISYTIKYTSCVDDEAHPGQRFGYEGYIGMPGPNSCNWYHGGFLFIDLDDKSVGRVPMIDMSVTENTSRALFQMVWDTPEGLVVVKFLRLPGEDVINASIAWKPPAGKSLKSVKIKARCYPCFFTSTSDRILVTPNATTHQRRERVPISPDKDTFLFYADTNYDAAISKQGFGPCALIFTKDPVDSAAVNVGPYAVDSFFTLKPDAGEARFIFVDFAKRTNADALNFLRTNADALRRRLTSLSFISNNIASFDTVARKAEIDRLLAQAGEDAKSIREPILKSFAELASLKGAVTGIDSWKSERDFTDAYERFSQLLYRLKIEAMMNEK